MGMILFTFVLVKDCNLGLWLFILWNFFFSCSPLPHPKHVMDWTIILLDSLFQVFSYTFKKHLIFLKVVLIIWNQILSLWWGWGERLWLTLQERSPSLFQCLYPITAERLGVSWYALSIVNILPVDNFVIKVNQLMNLNRNKYRRNR